MLFKKVPTLYFFEFSLLLGFCLLLFFLIGYTSFIVHNGQQFVALAQSFSQGKLYFLNSPPSIWDDSVLWKGHYFWPQSPFPALLLLPFVVFFQSFGQIFYQGYLHFFIVVATLVLWQQIAFKLGYKRLDAFYLGFAFCFSSAYLGLTLFPWSWFFAQVITTFVLSLALYLFFFHKRRYLLIGFLLGIAAFTRIDTIFAVIFFIIVRLFTPGGKQEKIVSIISLLCFPTLAMGLTALYNFARFESVMNFGHSLIPRGDWHSEFLKQGTWSFVHLPRNLFYATLGGPIITLSPLSVMANPWGMSIFLTAPYLLYLFRLRPKDLISRSLLITSAAMLLFLVCLFTSGAKQFGYRYSMDFFPFLFLLLIRLYHMKRKSLSPLFKTIIVGSALLNLYLFSTIY